MLGKVYYVLYADGCAIQSKAAFDFKKLFLGRIRVDSVAPPHSVASIKRCLSRVERNLAIAYAADLFVDISGETPLKEGHISLRTDGPGMSPNAPIAIILAPPIPGPANGRYLIKNRAADIYWNASYNPIKTIFFDVITTGNASRVYQVNEHPIIRLFRG